MVAFVAERQLDQGLPHWDVIVRWFMAGTGGLGTNTKVSRDQMVRA
jgi:hypothetical protein